MTHSCPTRLSAGLGAVARRRFEGAAARQPVVDGELLHLQQRLCAHAGGSSRQGCRQAAAWPGSMRRSPGCAGRQSSRRRGQRPAKTQPGGRCNGSGRSEEHTSELQSLMRISYAVFCLKKKKNTKQNRKVVIPNKEKRTLRVKSEQKTHRVKN